jgi:D-alanine-D-alanine ligase
MARQKVAILAGGYSSEWEISMQSAGIVYKHLPREFYEPYIVSIRKDGWKVLEEDRMYDLDLNLFGFHLNGELIRFDLAFNAIHGHPGENGPIQGYLEARGISHTSCNQAVSVLTFNKWQCNSILKLFGFNCAKSLLLQRHDEINEEFIIDELKLPLFVKPNNSGSSFGVSKVKTKADLIPAIEKAWEEDSEVVLESFMDGTELGVGVFRHENMVIPLPPTEIRSENEFFDYEAKYQGKAQEITPAEISDEMTVEVQKISRDVYKRLNASGLIRVDFMIVGKVPHIIEVNTVPGLSAESIVPKQVKCMGLDLGHFFHMLLQEASF